MKNIPALLLAHYQEDVTYLAHALRIQRWDNKIYAYTSASENCELSVDVDGDIITTQYIASQGLDVTTIKTTSTLGVDNLELTTFDDGTIFTRVDVLSGAWTNSKFTLVRYCWKHPEWGFESLLTGTLGEVQKRNSQITVELRGLQQYLQQPIAVVTSKTCRAELGDSQCGIDLEYGTEWSTIGAKLHTVITVGREFIVDVAAIGPSWAPVPGIFTNGLMQVEGQWLRIGSSSVYMGTLYYVALQIPTVLEVLEGMDTQLRAGCNKRLLEDCKSTFNNVLRFQGEPHVPGVDAVTRGKA